jgi:hypothetical protein
MVLKMFVKKWFCKFYVGLVGAVADGRAELGVLDDTGAGLEQKANRPLVGG